MIALRQATSRAVRSRSLQRCIEQAGPCCSHEPSRSASQKAYPVAHARHTSSSAVARRRFGLAPDPILCLGPWPWASLTSVSLLHTSAVHLAEETKTERTLKLLMEELEEADRAEKAARKDIKLVPKDGEAVAKPSLALRAWVGVKHFVVSTYLGLKLLCIDIYIALGYVLRMAKGKKLSRREWRQLTVTVADIFRIVPFSIFIIVPMAEVLLPFYMKFFPGMLPSTFKGFSNPDQEKERIARKLKEKTAFAAFLQSVQEELAVERSGKDGKDSKDGKSMALDFAHFIKKVRAEGGYVSNKELLKYTKLFENELTLDNLAQPQLRAMCGVVGIPPLGSPGVLRFQLLMRLRGLAADDKKIVQEGGVDKLTIGELQMACRDRGMRALGISQDRLRLQLRQWLELSLDEKVPPSLLLLSRTLYLPADVSFTDRLKSLLSTLPDEVAEETRDKIAELETGKLDYAARIALVHRVQKAVKAEREEKRRLDEAAAPPKDPPVVVESGRWPDLKEPDGTGRIIAEMSAGGVKDTAELVDSAPVLSDTAPVFKEIAAEAEMLRQATETEMLTHSKAEAKPAAPHKEEQLEADDFKRIQEVLLTAAGKFHDVKGHLADLKEAVEEHKDDVKSVAMILKEQLGEKAKQPRAAALLSSRVDKLITGADKLVEKLHEEKEVLNIDMDKLTAAKGPTDKTSVADIKAKLVSINELMLSLLRLQRVPDDSKMQQIQKVLEALDVDKDGAIDLDNAFQVIELLGEENVKISPEQMSKIAGMLATEEKVEEQEYLKALKDPVAQYIYGRVKAQAKNKTPSQKS